MNRGLWIARKNHLCCLIKAVSEGHGVDDNEFFMQHCREVLEAHPDESIEGAIKQYQEIVDQLGRSLK